MTEKYFVDLNYTLSNEDTRIENHLLKEGANKVFTICGSGARVIPLLAKNPEEIDIVDMSQPQIDYFKLRLQAIKDLNYEEYLYFMGYRGGIPDGKDNGDCRLSLFNKIQLEPDLKKYWLNRSDHWQSKGFILLGKWEGHFQKISKVFRNYLKCNIHEIFEAQNLEEQVKLYNMHWPNLRWNSFIRIAASEYVFNKYLYKGHFAGSEGHRTETRPPYQFLKEEFERLFKTQLVRKNYFMQILFLGTVRYEEGLPLEAHRHIFDIVKNNKTKINYYTGNLLDFLNLKPYDFISLSDTISYLSTEDSNQILQKLHKESPKSAKVVIRSFLRAPQEVDSNGWKQNIDLQNWAYQKDGTGVYQFHIYSKI